MKSQRGKLVPWSPVSKGKEKEIEEKDGRGEERGENIAKDAGKEKRYESFFKTREFL